MVSIIAGVNGMVFTNHGNTTNISKKVLIMEKQHILQNHTIHTSDDTNHE
jgi:hypothetical protein